MSLATRCSDCGTVFRVVQDQLRVSEGWVRCGRCDAVFNAFEDLLDLQRDGPIGAKGGQVLRAGQHEAIESVVDAAGIEIADPGNRACEPAPRLDLLATPGDDADADADAAAAADRVAHADTDTDTDTGAADDAADARAAAVPGASLATFAQHATTPDDASTDRDDGDAMGLAAIDDEIDAHLFGHRHRGAPRDVDQRDRLDFSDARFDSELPSDALFEEAHQDESTPPDVAELPLEVAATPEFLRRAERSARWQSRPWRAALGTAALLLGATLALQAAHHFRDSVAARWSGTRPLLAAWCNVTGCSVEAPRRIGEISVESTALTRAAGLDAFRLAVMLRSHSALALALPSVELSLTDANGRLVTRRALAPADFHLAQAVLPPGAELPLQLLLDARGNAITGYTVEIFYP